MKIFLSGLIIGIIFGLAGGLFTDGKFHPDLFVLATIISYIIIIWIEIRKLREVPKSKSKSPKAC